MLPPPRRLRTHEARLCGPALPRRSHHVARQVQLAGLGKPARAWANTSSPRQPQAPARDGPLHAEGWASGNPRLPGRLPAGRVRPSPRSDGRAGPTALSAASRWDASISVSPRAPCLHPLHRRPAFPSPLSTREVGSRRISPLPPTGIRPRHLRAPGRTSCLFA